MGQLHCVHYSEISELRILDFPSKVSQYLLVLLYIQVPYAILDQYGA